MSGRGGVLRVLSTRAKTVRPCIAALWAFQDGEIDEAEFQRRLEEIEGRINDYKQKPDRSTH